jgi:hypothetical protein
MSQTRGGAADGAPAPSNRQARSAYSSLNVPRSCFLSPYNARVSGEQRALGVALESATPRANRRGACVSERHDGRAQSDRLDCYTATLQGFVYP